jgi:hypothetical protein
VGANDQPDLDDYYHNHNFRDFNDNRNDLAGRLDPIARFERQPDDERGNLDAGCGTSTT